jgi:hypothetical protein
MYYYNNKIIIIYIGETSGSHGGEYENAFWDVAPCILVEVNRRFRGARCLHHQGDRHFN